MGDPIFKRDIFSTAIEFVIHFPIHFALINAYISADGALGIFTYNDLNHTEKIIGSEYIVATDWIGGAKMGLEPMVSNYEGMAVDYKEPSVGRRLAKIFADPTKSLFFQWL
jgi:hypothetical protein